MSSAPDLTAPVVGFRAWRVANGRLVSPYVPCRWDGRVMRAECYDANRGLLRGEGWLARPHGSPHPDCRCGIYAYHTPGPRTYFGESWWCAGLISAWGHLEVHADGLRAQFARVEALSEPEAADSRLRGAVGEIAQRLGVPVVSQSALSELADELGGTVPDGLRARRSALR